ncbi:MAG: tetratricopeptide repeat protein [Deferrisomatales bacterium]|nr:tetratricopeptide repeat protein [Deferrisomatales bacterium]
MNRTRSFRWFEVVAVIGALAILSLSVGCAKNPAEKARELRQRADTYREAGQNQEASIEYQAALQVFPEDAEAMFGLAKSLEALGQQTEYRETLARLLRLEAGHPQACVELGGLLWASGNYTEALDLSRRVPSEAVAGTNARRLEARALASLGQREESRNVWKRLLEERSQDEAIYLDAALFEGWSGEGERAAEILQAGLKVIPQAISLRLALAQLQMGAGDFEAAEVALGEAETTHPESPLVLATRARLLIRQGQLQAGLDFLEQAQDRYPKAAAAIALERARLLLQLGAASQARKVLEVAQDAHPGHPGLGAVLADVLITEGRPDEAREFFPLARKFDPSGRIPRLLEARAHLADGRAHWALLVLENLVAKGDLSVETRFLYAVALAREARWAMARREYVAVLRRVPDHVLARIEFARLLRVQRDFAGALAQFDALPESVAQGPRIRLEKAQVLLDRGDAAEARTILQEILTESPSNPVVLKLMGDVEQVSGRFKQARLYYGKSREQNPRAVEPLFAEAKVLLQSGSQAREVVALLQDHQLKQGEDPRVLNMIARIHLEGGERLEAQRALDRSVLLESNYWETRVLRAAMLIGAGEGPKAAVELEEAINLNPVHPDAYNMLAQIYRERGDFTSAETTYQRLLDWQPGDPQTANNLANLLLEQGRVDEALRWAREAYAGAPKNPSVLDTLGWALERAGQAAEAEPFLREALASYSDHPEVLLHWGVNLASRGLTGEAELILQEVVSLAGDTPPAVRAREVLREIR